MAWYVYLIECRGGSIYTGIAIDVAARYAAHVAGKGARYTRAHPPKRLLAAFEYPDRSAASTAEYRIKQLTARGKRALCRSKGRSGAEAVDLRIRRSRRSLEDMAVKRSAHPEPHRVQLSRRKGWRMPPNTVKVDRTTRFGNPFRPGSPGIPDRRASVRMFERAFHSGALARGDPNSPFTPENIRAELRGKNLACWCPLDDACHADVLLVIAND